MTRYGWLLLVLFFVACHNKKPSLSEESEVDATDFFDAFAKLNLPFSVADTSLSQAADTTAISTTVMNQFVPDTAFNQTNKKSDTKSARQIIHPVGKIESGDDTYLLATFTEGKSTTLQTFLFNKEKKYVTHYPLLNTATHDGYVHTVDVNNEPTFTITKDKTDKDRYRFTKNGYAYNKDSKTFIEVIHDSNEDADGEKTIIDPVDTLAHTFKFSGNYVKDKMNFISVRDGNIPNHYLFFIHFEKNKGDCTGELKGMMRMVDATKAVFTESGDPCVIDFTFKNNSVIVKERGSCGNHRGITCLFDDTYKKKTEETKKAKKK